AAQNGLRWPQTPAAGSSVMSATSRSGAAVPLVARSTQQMPLRGVSGSTVYIAMRTLDKAGNISALSNVVCLGSCGMSGAASIARSSLPVVARTLGGAGIDSGMLVGFVLLVAVRRPRF